MLEYGLLVAAWLTHRRAVERAFWRGELHGIQTAGAMQTTTDRAPDAATIAETGEGAAAPAPIAESDEG